MNASTLQVEEWRKGAEAEMGDGGRSVGVMLEAREVQDGSDLREMISEMRGDVWCVTSEEDAYCIHIHISRIVTWASKIPVPLISI